MKPLPVPGASWHPLSMTFRPQTRRLPCASLVAALLALTPAVALAQGAPFPGAAPPESEGAVQRPPPAALPGLQGRQGSVAAPAEIPSAAMNPNDALFDGISRGDLPAVRDAVRRGADLRAQSALGLTPLEAAVDQARPDITFFLLSVRGGAGMASSGPPPEAAPQPRARPRPQARPVRTPPPPRVVPTPTVRADGGQPIPSIGFLGFDPRG